VSTWQPSGPPPGERDPRKLSELLDRTTRRLGGPSSGTATTVFAGWAAIVGSDIAAQARPVSLHDGVLVLVVDQPAWANQLRYMTADLLTRIADAGAGAEVTEIHIRVAGDNPAPGRFARGRKRRS
jgi:predicted nucleic acid-binding Zn ribbon protein